MGHEACTAWDPLQLDKHVGIGLLQQLCSPSNHNIPAGLSTVKSLVMEVDDSDLSPNFILYLKDALRTYFCCLNHILIVGVDHYWMDMYYTEIRCWILAQFGVVKLINSRCSGGTESYTLLAERNAEPPLVNLQEIFAENHWRLDKALRDVPDLDADDRSQWTHGTQISDIEALFLLEHAHAVKLGDTIHFMHSHLCSNARDITEAYKVVVSTRRDAANFDCSLLCRVAAL